MQTAFVSPRSRRSWTSAAESPVRSPPWTSWASACRVGATWSLGSSAVEGCVVCIRASNQSTDAQPDMRWVLSLPPVHPKFTTALQYCHETDTHRTPARFLTRRVLVHAQNGAQFHARLSLSYPRKECQMFTRIVVPLECNCADHAALDMAQDRARLYNCPIHLI